MKKNIISLATAGLVSLAVAATAFASPATVERSVNFRSAPSTGSKVFQTLKPGISIDVQQQVNAYWLKVSVNGKVGYLSPSYITYDKPSTNQPPVDQQPSSAIVASSVNFRSAPSTSSTVYGSLKPGTPVNVLEEVNAYWLKVEVNGKTGYLSPKYITYSGVQQPAPEPTPTPAPAPSAVAARVIQHAKNLQGVTHYAYGVNQAPSLMDCSAMIQYVFGKEDIKLKWGTRYLKDAGTYVPRDELQPGDLVLLRVGSSSSIGHVGIYMGNGQMIHNSPSADGIQIISIASGYWSTRYVTARRVI